MSDFGEQMVFRKLLDRHQRVQIPKIQRDYAQGRESAGEVRAEFLKALSHALSLPKKDPSLPLNLDFIYGSVEGENDTKFLPLDGQQRLTTLFLIHWYAAWSDECLNEFRDWIAPNSESLFTYDVRPTSEDFFDALLKFEPGEAPTKETVISALIKDQPWYFRYWRLDPTIQSVLTMLDAIHADFHMHEDLYDRLLDESSPAITFQLLDLDNFGLSDDLYIKMNARGKPLTEFETFKARFEQHLEELFGDEETEIDGEVLSISSFFSRRIDTKWADFFWEYRDRKSHTADDAVMNLFRAVILIARNPRKPQFVRDIPSLQNEFLSSTFTVFKNKDWLDKTFAKSLILLLETWNGVDGRLALQLPDAKYFDESAIIQRITKSATALDYSEVAQFSAYLFFLKKHEDHEGFQDWMRIVFNLSNNTLYNRPSDLRSSIAGLKKIVPHAKEILDFLANGEKPPVGFNRQQIQEEVLKAALMLAHPKWRELIVAAENHGYFRGQIEFLLDFCGVLEEWEESGLVNLSDQDHEKFQDEFEFYRLRAFEMFTPHGLLNLGENRWERALLTFGDYLLPHGNQNVSFLINSSTESTSWKRLLRDNSLRRGFVKELWDNLPLKQELAVELDELIDSATDLKPWIEAIVETPEAIEFCKRRAIRRGGSRIYLVKSVRLSGPHAELFTFCLYQEWKKTKAPEDFQPLEMQSYYAPSGIETEPGIRLHCEIDGTSLFFDVERAQRKFALSFEFEEGDSERAELIEFLRDRSILEKEGNKIALVERIELEDKIDILRKAVSDYIKSIEKDA